MTIWGTYNACSYISKSASAYIHLYIHYILDNKTFARLPIFRRSAGSTYDRVFRRLEIAPQLLPPGIIIGQLALGKLPDLVQITSPAGLQVDLEVPPVPRLEDKLVDNIYDREQGQQDVCVHKVTRIEGAQRSPSLNQRQEGVGREPEVRIPRVPQGLEREVGLGVPLGLPGRAEPDVDEADAPPDEERRHAREVDDVRVGGAGSRRDVHHAQGAAQVRQDDGRDGHAPAIRPAQDARGLAVLAHEEQGPAADEDAAVDGGQAGDEDEGVDEVHAGLPARVLDGDGHGAAEGLAAGRHEALGVGRAGQAEEEGGAHVDEDDAPEDLADGLGDGGAGVPGLGGGDGDGLAPGVEGAAEDEHRGDAPEAVAREGARVVPVPEADGGRAVDAARGVDDGEDEEGEEAGQLEKGEPELGLAEGLDAEELEAEEGELEK